MNSYEDFKKELKSDEFINYNNINKKKIECLINFLDDIDINKNYYKLGIKKNKRYKNYKNNIINDTIEIKNIINTLNKLTLQNYESIINDFNFNNENILPLIVENIIEKSLIHHKYIEIYIKFLIKLNEKYNIIKIINKYIEKYKNKLFNYKNNTSTYNDLCEKNINLNNIIGFSIFLTYLEKNEIINDINKIIIENIINKINIDNVDDLYNIIVCIFNIQKIKGHIDEVYITKLNDIKNNVPSKIKFKIMDIIESNSD